MRIRLAAALALLSAAGALSAASDRQFYGTKHGYLAHEADIRPAIEPAPHPGDARDAADRRIFRETRALVGTPRYALAARDAEINPQALGRDFSCAVGVTLTRETAPRTFALIDRTTIDTGLANADAKDVYKRTRPFLVEPGPICQPREELAGSWDYPSGHTTYGWTWGYALADLLPDRATAILARARAYGQSRYICGAHNFSAVLAGEAGASATMAAVRQTAAYHADAKRARRELRRLIADPRTPRPAGCDAERALIAQP